MDKLIRLLQQRTIECGGNEERKLRGGKIYLTRKSRTYPHYDTNAIIISKRFGFIKWLVENDKIDESLRNAGIELYHTSYNMYEGILMLLAISDTPIDDLISYLK